MIETRINGLIGNILAKKNEIQNVLTRGLNPNVNVSSMNYNYL